MPIHTNYFRVRWALSAAVLFIALTGALFVYVSQFHSGAAKLKVINDAPPTDNAAAEPALRLNDDGATHFSPPFRARIGNRVGFIDARGELVIPPDFVFATPGFRDGLCMVSTREGSGYIDSTGAWRIPPALTPERRGLFSEGLAPVSKVGEPYGYIDVNGAQVIEPQYDTAGPFVNGFAVVGIETTWSKIRNRFADVGLIVNEHFIDRRGRRVDPEIAARFRRDDDTFGRSIWVDGGASFDMCDLLDAADIRIFEWTRSFSEGLAAARLDGKWGFVDHDLEFVIEPQFDDALYFRSGIAEVRKDGRWIYVDRAGRRVWPKD